MLLRNPLFVLSAIFTASSLASPVLTNSVQASNSNAIRAKVDDYRQEDILLRAQDVDEQVCQANSPFFIPHQTTSKDNAAAVCGHYGGELAPISNQNFVDVTGLLFNCRGPMSRAWIKTWDDTDYGSNCLTLYTGPSIPGGGIDINCVGESLIVPICVQKRGGVSVGNKSKPSPGSTSVSDRLTLTGSAFTVATSTSFSISASPFISIQPIPEDTISFSPSNTPIPHYALV